MPAFRATKTSFVFVDSYPFVTLDGNLLTVLI